MEDGRRALAAPVYVREPPCILVRTAQTLVRRRLWRPRSGPQGAERIAYDLYSARVELQGIPWPEEFVARRDEVEQLADKNAVPISYSRMPVHPEMRNLYATVYADHYARYRDLFVGRCLFDLDAARPGGWIPEQFRDAVHLEAAYRLELVAALRHGLRTPVRCEAGLGSGGAHLWPKALAGGDPTLVCFHAERE